MDLPILCLDFDGVLHSYTSGWKGAAVIPDPPVPGAFDFLVEACKHFNVMIYSSRSNHPGGIEAMAVWIAKWCPVEIFEGITCGFPTEKPAAMVTLDDRALTFTGVWPSMDSLLNFKPWNKK